MPICLEPTLTDTMPDPSRYFLYGYFGIGNFGDDLLLYSTLHNIDLLSPHSTFCIRSHGYLGKPDKFASRITEADFETIHAKSLPRPAKLALLLREYWRCAGKVDLVLVGGGTLIHDRPYLNATALLLLFSAIARLRGRPVVGIGLGTKTIESGAGRFLLRLLLKVFTQISLRDRKSYDTCLALSSDNSRIRLTSDLAFALPWQARSATSAGKIVAVSLVDYMFTPSQATDTALAALARSVESLIGEGYAIRLLVLQQPDTAPGVVGDQDCLTRLQNLLSPSARASCTLETVEVSPVSIERAYQSVALTIGMRFHSLVLSAMQGAPFLGLAHEPKINAFCEEFSMPCLGFNSITTEQINAGIEQAMSKTIDMNQIRRCHEDALKNFKEWTAS